jgi:hypothetical protein
MSNSGGSRGALARLRGRGEQGLWCGLLYLVQRSMTEVRPSNIYKRGWRSLRPRKRGSAPRSVVRRLSNYYGNDILRTR